MKLVLSLVLLAGSVAFSSLARAEEPVEHQRFPPSSVRRKVIAAGVLFVGIGYGGALGTAYGWADAPGSNELKIPVVGPWVALAKAGCPSGQAECGASLGLRVFLSVLEGLVQTGGLAFVAEGVFMTTEAAADVPARKTSSAFIVRPVPLVTPTFTGAALVGSF
jgi:hypothetical protein